MQLHGDIILNGRRYPKGTSVPWYAIYPFFLVHMLAFGASGFLMAYGAHRPPLVFLYLHGGLAIAVYTAFYLVIFGPDDVKWMFINAGLGLLGIYSQISWLLSLAGKRASDYPPYVHAIPFLYYVLYTFLLRHAVTDLTASRGNPARQAVTDRLYVAGSIVLYLGAYWLEQRGRATF